MKKRFVESLTLIVMTVFVLLEFSCVKGSVPENGTPSKDEVSEAAPAIKKAHDPSQVIVAWVNGREITSRVLENEMDSIFRKRGFRNQPTVKETGLIREEALDYLIFLELAAEYGQKTVKVGDEEIDSTIKQLKADLETEKAFNDYLGLKNFTEETLRKDIEKKYVIQKILEQEVYSRVAFDEEETRREYEAHPENFTIPAGIEVDIVNIQPMNGDWKEAAKRANELAAELKEGKSTDDIKDKRGLLIDTMTISEEKNPKLFSRVSGLEPSGVSSVYDDENSFQVMRVRQKTPEQLIAFDRAKKWFEDKENTKRAKEWYEELKKDAKIEILR